MSATPSLTTPAVTAPWTLSDGPPAPPTLLTKDLSKMFAEAFMDESLAGKLNLVFARFCALTIEDLHDVDEYQIEDALKCQSLDPKKWLKKLTQFIFQDPMAGFKPLPSRNSSSMSNSSCSTGTESANNERYFAYEENKANATMYLGGLSAWSTFSFGQRMSMRIHAALAVGKIDETTALHLVFKFNLLVFKTRYMAIVQKSRYAVLLNSFNASISISTWQTSLQSGFSNRRGGRFDKMRFHPTEFSEFLAELENEDKFHGKLVSCVHEPMLLPDGFFKMPTMQERVALFVSMPPFSAPTHSAVPLLHQPAPVRMPTPLPLPFTSANTAAAFGGGPNTLMGLFNGGPAQTIEEADAEASAMLALPPPEQAAAEPAAAEPATAEPAAAAKNARGSSPDTEKVGDDSSEDEMPLNAWKDKKLAEKAAAKEKATSIRKQKKEDAEKDKVDKKAAKRAGKGAAAAASKKAKKDKQVPPPEEEEPPPLGAHPMFVVGGKDYSVVNTFKKELIEKGSIAYWFGRPYNSFFTGTIERVDKKNPEWYNVFFADGHRMKVHLDEATYLKRWAFIELQQESQDFEEEPAGHDETTLANDDAAAAEEAETVRVMLASSATA